MKLMLVMYSYFGSVKKGFLYTRNVDKEIFAQQVQA